MDPVQDGLTRWFGHEGFRPGQERVIRILLEGRSSLAVLPTGGGKSVCYQLPALLLEGLTLVVSPLLALMRDQVEKLIARGIPAARIDSTLSQEACDAIRCQIEAGKLKLLYLSPEQLGNDVWMPLLRRTPVTLMAVDEAHCLSEWGHSFRPDYLRIPKLARQLGVQRVVALTATATPQVSREIAKAFRIKAADRVQTSFLRPNLQLAIKRMERDARLPYLIASLQKAECRPAIVYVTLQQTAATVSAQLAEAGIRAAPYHAGLPDSMRVKVQQDFMQGNIDVVVATMAFGMGVDKAGIRTVYHYNLPRSLENYQQETGRAGRDGAPARGELLASGDDRVVLENFALASTPSPLALSWLMDHLLGCGGTISISRFELSQTLDLRLPILETVLVYLEELNLLRSAGAYHSKFDLTFVRSQLAAVEGHSPTTKRHLQTILSTGQQGRRGLRIEVPIAAEAAGMAKERVIELLETIEAAGDVGIHRSGIRHEYRLGPAASRLSPREVTAILSERFQHREALDLGRLETMIDFAEQPGCSTRRLLKYFGETLRGNCGRCGNCLTPFRKRRPLPHAVQASLTTEELGWLAAVDRQQHAALRTPRQLARFLCGIWSPATLRDRLTNDEAFGVLAHLPFSVVLSHIDR